MALSLPLASLSSLLSALLLLTLALSLPLLALSPLPLALPLLPLALPLLPLAFLLLPLALTSAAAVVARRLSPSARNFSRLVARPLSPRFLPCGFRAGGVVARPEGQRHHGTFERSPRISRSRWLS